MKHVRKFNKAAAKLGFTLIELSIVLVIIGLIVGGILVGQDLIKAAEIRATVSQMEKYATAVNTFRSKYNGLPGDLLNAGNLGFDTGVLRNGNAQIESLAGTSATFQGETSCFWDDLSSANLIADSLNAGSSCGATSSPSVLSSVIPIAKLGRGNYLVVGSSSGINYWGLTGVTGISAGAYAFDDLLTGSEAFQIDSKVDDGAPTSGSVIATTATAGGAIFSLADTPIAIGSIAATDCVVGNNTYNFSTTANNGNSQACQLRLRSNF